MNASTKKFLEMDSLCGGEMRRRVVYNLGAWGYMALSYIGFTVFRRRRMELPCARLWSIG